MSVSFYDDDPREDLAKAKKRIEFLERVIKDAYSLLISEERSITPNVMKVRQALQNLRKGF